MTATPLLGLRWAIKRSFLDYIARSPGGGGTLSDGAVATGSREVVFAPDPRRPPVFGAEGAVHAFQGAVTFTAHFGSLLVKIANPWVTIRGGQGELTVLDPFRLGHSVRLRVAAFGIDDHLIADGFDHWFATDVRLAPEGCGLFNDVYLAGAPLEPITIIVPHVRATSGLEKDGG